MAIEGFEELDILNGRPTLSTLVFTAYFYGIVYHDTMDGGTSFIMRWLQSF